MFDGFEATTSFDPFPDSSDTDRTGLDTDIDNLADTDPFEPDDEADEGMQFEDLDDDDVEVGESLDEESINEVDMDFEPDDIEPDWAPDDGDESQYDATDSSEENETIDTDLDDAPYDQWDEVSQVEETSEWNDILQDDEISQLEETGFDEPLIYEDDDDDDWDHTDNAEEDITILDHMVDSSDIEGEIDQPGAEMDDVASWIDALEDFIDFTEQDTSSFHEVSEGFEITDGYDPPVSDFMADDMLELGNFVDDVFAEVIDSQFVDADPNFAWFDSFDDF